MLVGNHSFLAKRPCLRYTLTVGWLVGAMALGLAAPAWSQALVTLEAPNGSVSITGELISADDQSYTIKGSLGLITLPRNGVICTGASCPGTEPEAPAPVSSRQVVLDSIDDETKITGELVGVEDNFYVIRNTLGEFRVAIANVNCIGEACPSTNAPDTGVTIMAASPRINAMMIELLQNYADATDQPYELKTEGGSTQSIQVFSADGQDLVADISMTMNNAQESVVAFSSGEADILVYGDQQVSGLLEGFDGILEWPLAFDGQVVVSNPDNPIRSLSRREIEQVWNGELTTWASLGGGDFPISVHMVADEASPDVWLTGLRASTTPGVIAHNAEEAVLKAIKGDRNAVGVVHWSTADQENARMLAVRKSCGLDAAPSKFGIRTQHYDFTQPINAYGNGAKMQPFVQSFLEWAQTAQADTSVSKFGYLSARPQREKIQDMGVAVIHTAAVEPDFDGVEFSAMMRELRAADRLSLTFRFLTGSSVLDEASVRNIKDLARRLPGNEFTNLEVLLVGFADSTGPADRNTDLSLRRSESVRSVLAAEFDEETRISLKLTELGFGEQMPVDCNTTATGRANNRRVEVWVRVKS